MSNTNNVISRREFCVSACCAASCATLTTLLSGCGGSSTSPSGSASLLDKSTGKFTGTGVQVTVGGSALASVGGAVLVESDAGVFLLARMTQSSFSAIEAICTHEGCTVTGADGNEYVCPCHGSRYDRSGHVVHGPATASLRQYATSLAGDVVTIAL
jgi:cytochrome b6-f complex iron-sulfur subunit